jgi:hypothetical protein
MDQVMISLLAPTNVSPERIDAWVDEQVYRLRSRWRISGIGIGELRRSSPSKGGHWLIDLDLCARTGPLEQDVAVAGIIIDFERLGLRPQLFVLAPGRRHERRVRPARRAFEQIPACGTRRRTR